MAGECRLRRRPECWRCLPGDEPILRPRQVKYCQQCHEHKENIQVEEQFVGCKYTTKNKSKGESGRKCTISSNNNHNSSRPRRREHENDLPAFRFGAKGQSVPVAAVGQSASSGSVNLNEQRCSCRGAIMNEALIKVHANSPTAQGATSVLQVNKGIKAKLGASKVLLSPSGLFLFITVAQAQECSILAVPSTTAAAATTASTSSVITLTLAQAALVVAAIINTLFEPAGRWGRPGAIRWPRRRVKSNGKCRPTSTISSAKFLLIVFSLISSLCLFSSCNSGSQATCASITNGRGLDADAAGAGGGAHQTSKLETDTSIGAAHAIGASAIRSRDQAAGLQRNHQRHLTERPSRPFLSLVAADKIDLKQAKMNSGPAGIGPGSNNNNKDNNLAGDEDLAADEQQKGKGENSSGSTGASIRAGRDEDERVVGARPGLGGMGARRGSGHEPAGGPMIEAAREQPQPDQLGQRQHELDNLQLLLDRLIPAIWPQQQAGSGDDDDGEQEKDQLDGQANLSGGGGGDTGGHINTDTDTHDAAAADDEAKYGLKTGSQIVASFAQRLAANQEPASSGTGEANAAHKLKVWPEIGDKLDNNESLRERNSSGASNGAVSSATFGETWPGKRGAQVQSLTSGGKTTINLPNRQAAPDKRRPAAALADSTLAAQDGLGAGNSTPPVRLNGGRPLAPYDSLIYQPSSSSPAYYVEASSSLTTGGQSSAVDVGPANKRPYKLQQQQQQQQQMEPSISQPIYEAEAALQKHRTTSVAASGDPIRQLVSVHSNNLYYPPGEHQDRHQLKLAVPSLKPPPTLADYNYQPEAAAVDHSMAAALAEHHQQTAATVADAAHYQMQQIQHYHHQQQYAPPAKLAQAYPASQQQQPPPHQFLATANMNNNNNIWPAPPYQVSPATSHQMHQSLSSFQPHPNSLTAATGPSSVHYQQPAPARVQLAPLVTGSQLWTPASLTAALQQPSSLAGASVVAYKQPMLSAPAATIDRSPLSASSAPSPLSVANLLAFLVNNKSSISNLIQLLPLIAQTISTLPRVFGGQTSASSAGSGTSGLLALLQQGHQQLSALSSSSAATSSSPKLDSITTQSAASSSNGGSRVGTGQHQQQSLMSSLSDRRSQQYNAGSGTAAGQSVGAASPLAIDNNNNNNNNHHHQENNILSLIQSAASLAQVVKNGNGLTTKQAGGNSSGSGGDATMADNKRLSGLQALQTVGEPVRLQPARTPPPIAANPSAGGASGGDAGGKPPFSGAAALMASSVLTSNAVKSLGDLLGRLLQAQQQAPAANVDAHRAGGSTAVPPATSPAMLAADSLIRHLLATAASQFRAGHQHQ